MQPLTFVIRSTKSVLQAFLCLISVASVAQAPQSQKHPTLEIGASAPDFSLPGVDGKTYSLKSFAKSKFLVVVFTCNHCPTAQAYEEPIKKLVTDYQSRGVAFVAISPNDPKSIRLDELGYTDLSDSFEEMKIRSKDLQYNFPYLYDGETSTASMTYGPQATPHVFIFDQQRKLQYTGRIDDGLGLPGEAKTFDTSVALNQLLAGQPVAVAKTKTFGCSVKWPEKHNLVNAEATKWKEEKVSLEEAGMDSIKSLLSNKSGNYRLINIWATWCGPCVSEFPDFVTINRMYRLREFETVSISLDDISRKNNALGFLQKKEASFQNYIYNGDKYAFIEAIDKEWQGALPYTVLLAPGGEVVYRTQGSIDPLELKKIILNSLGRVMQIPTQYKERAKSASVN
ncbi:redoxin family protein [Chryseolinea sp. T2]|uniref:redoxin family protein n=1 Tax=Chryseolinea sp. T2 TaxID=3129255 RepID=UPI003076F9A7